jgi:hypothetical protein
MSSFKINCYDSTLKLKASFSSTTLPTFPSTNSALSSAVALATATTAQAALPITTHVPTPSSGNITKTVLTRKAGSTTLAATFLASSSDTFQTVMAAADPGGTKTAIIVAALAAPTTVTVTYDVYFNVAIVADTGTSKPKSKMTTIIIAAVAAVVLLLIIGVIIYFVMRKGKNSGPTMQMGGYMPNYQMPMQPQMGMQQGYATQQGW